MTNEIIEQCGQKMEKSIESLKKDFAGIRTGKANPSILNGVTVEYYGSQMPINQIANVSAPDPQSIVIKPYDKSILRGIEKAIQTANLGFNPQNDGELMYAYYNFFPVDITIKKHDAVGQAYFQKFLVADNDNATGKRLGGFGSTDKKS